ncbi:DUF6193 family natural product biosynthesis protein [Nonomuraea sp. 3N208]|uniref:DUF6193 family natural product biosynthesis protein n=1 Tax=Nonomuraea sp. 3N208 TaxID=3457421 RepID=UPI003FD2C136
MSPSRPAAGPPPLHRDRGTRRAGWAAPRLARYPAGGTTADGQASLEDARLSANSSSTDLVEAGWNDVRADGRLRPELIEAAYAEPRLRQLFPWTGMGELHFSRCTGKRWTWDIPYVAADPAGGYQVSGPLRGQTVGSAATPVEAIAMVVERLPVRCGPAFIGTPEDLAAHEAASARQARLAESPEGAE